MPKSEFELTDLPPMLQTSRWTIYLDHGGDDPHLSTTTTATTASSPSPPLASSSRCTNKWLGALSPGEVAIVNVRPDGYVGSVGRWDAGVDDVAAGEEAARWLDGYYGRFLEVPS